MKLGKIICLIILDEWVGAGLNELKINCGIQEYFLILLILYLNLSMNPTSKAYFQLHIAVVLYGLTAILGRLIELPGSSIVWYRMLIVIISFCVIPGIFSKLKEMPLRMKKWVAVIGLLLAIHWVTFFEAIKYSNVSITLSCFASTAFFIAIIEPLFFKQKVKWYELLLGIMVIVGISIIFGFSGKGYLLGIILALLSAVFIAFVTVLNKRFVSSYDVQAITFWQFIVGWLCLTVLAPIYAWFMPDLLKVPSMADWIYLLILAILCTTFAYTLSLRAMQYLSAFNSSLAYNLEPVYGMLMAAAIFQEYEELNTGFYIGAAIIVFSVGIYPVMKRMAG